MRSAACKHFLAFQYKQVPKVPHGPFIAKPNGYAEGVLQSPMQPAPFVNSPDYDCKSHYRKLKRALFIRV